MSKKRFNPLEDPPTASSSDEDDQMETTSLAGNSSDDESLKKPESSAPEKHQVSDEETDSDSQTEIKKKNPGSSKKAKPLTKKKRSLSETDGAAEAKKVKSGSGGEETKKSYFQRVWSEEDEIAALQGLIDYKKDTGVSPYDDTNAFYVSVKKSISFDVSKTQVMKKLRGLKNKYLGKEELAFSKPHDRKAFDLSKFVWGADGDSPVKSKKSSKKFEPVKQELASSPSLPNGKRCEDEEMDNKGEAPSVVEVDAFEKSVLVEALTRFGVDDLSAQKGWSRLALEDKKRFEEEWNELQLRELEFYSNKSGFIHEVVTKMAESFQPNP